MYHVPLTLVRYPQRRAFAYFTSVGAYRPYDTNYLASAHQRRSHSYDTLCDSWRVRTNPCTDQSSRSLRQSRWLSLGSSHHCANWTTSHTTQSFAPQIRQTHASRTGCSSRYIHSTPMQQEGVQNPTKRKSVPAVSPQEEDRPPKHLRPSEMVEPNGVKAQLPPSPETQKPPYPLPVDTQSIGKAVAVAETKEWQQTIESVVKRVVSIHFCQTCYFDTDPTFTSEATGFVVDAERGYILTNRHVVCAGPFWGYCIFDNHEECDVFPVYRDPVHDFGILRFDPKAIKYMPLHALTLRPDLAKVGAEIRVVGNDAGEKLSILSGVISRLDRNAPEYADGYSDFNTNYIQAAAAATGGSSGSPVVNINGSVVALQAGGRSDGAATDFFLPLDRPLRALKCIQNGERVSRGTLQTQWLLKPFDECRRLGLAPEREAAVRQTFPKETGMLVAEVVLPEGPAHEQVQEGDVLIEVNGQLLTQFIKLDEILDSSVGQTVKLLVQRGGKDVEVELRVGNLHDITPDRFVSVAGGSFHNLSYQQARQYAVACKGVFMCEAAGSFKFDGVAYGWMITSVDNKDTPDLDAFIKVMKGIPDRARVVVTYKHLRDMHTHNTRIIQIDRHWSEQMKLSVRNDDTGIWDFHDLADPLPAETPVPRSAQFITLEGVKNAAVADIVRCFVRLFVSLPISLDGFPIPRKVGFGLVIDAEKGLVLVSRAIVPYDFADITVTIADSILVDARVVFLHPVQNYAIIQYDPSLVDAPVQSARLSTSPIKQGAETTFFGFNTNFRPLIAKTTVTDVTAVAIPGNDSPRYRAINFDAITVDTNLAGQCGSGVLVSDDGTVEGLWLTYFGEESHSDKDIEYHLGLPTPGLLPVVNQVRQGARPSLRMLAAELSPAHMSQARIMGLSESWISRIEKEDPERHQIFMVRKVDAGLQDGLQESDLILTLNDKLLTRTADLDVLSDREIVNATIVRKRVEVNLQLRTVPTEAVETTRAVLFSGAILHRPHLAVRQQISTVHSDVYISYRFRGSPANMYGLGPTNFILAVNDVPTLDLTTFLTEVNKIPDNTYFRLKTMSFDDVPSVITMKKNEHYFPTTEYVKDESVPNKWRRITYKDGDVVVGRELGMKLVGR